MELGSLLLLSAVIGIAGLGAQFIAGKVFGVDLLDAMMQFFGNFLNLLSRAVGWAPKPIQIMMFVVFGVTFFGLVSNWILSAQYVCVEDTGVKGHQVLYEADSFITATLAKMLPDETETDPSVNREINASEILAAEQRIEANIESPGRLRDLSYFVYDPLSSSVSYSRWGTFLTEGKNTLSIPQITSTNPEAAELLLMALPKYLTLDENDEVPDEEQFYFGINSTFTLKKTEIEMTIYKESTLSALIAGRNAGRCYLDSHQYLTDGHEGMPFSVRISRSGLGAAEPISHVVYAFKRVNSATEGSRVVVGVYYEEFSNNSLSLCPRSGVPGESFVVTGSPTSMGDLTDALHQTFVDSSLARENVSGWVNLKYVPTNQLNVNNSDILDNTAMTRRRSFVQQNPDSFTMRTQRNQEGPVTRTCDADGNVSVLVYDLDLFSMKTLLTMIALGGIFWLLKALNLI